jgi:hypothetical protein
MSEHIEQAQHNDRRTALRLLTEFVHINGTVRLLEVRRGGEVSYLVENDQRHCLTPSFENAKTRFQEMVAAVPVFIGYGSYGCALPPLVADCADRDILHVTGDLTRVAADIGRIASEIEEGIGVSGEGIAAAARQRHQELQEPLCRLIGALSELDAMGKLS